MNELAVVDTGLPAVADDSGGALDDVGGHLASRDAKSGVPIGTAAEHVDLPRSVTASIPQDDIRTFQSFADHMGDVPTEFLERASTWYNKLLADQAAGFASLDAADGDQMRRTMGDEWGSEYQANVNLISGVLDALPIGVQEAIENARLDDGKMLLNTPVGLTWLLSMGRRPRVDVPPHSDEKSAIEELMRDTSSRYYKGPDAAALQSRYRDLIGRAPTAKSLPSGAAAINAEIAGIEKVMREERHRYNRDEAMQNRYLQLLELRDGK